jgi:hypothetical protein
MRLIGSARGHRALQPDQADVVVEPRQRVRDGLGGRERCLEYVGAVDEHRRVLTSLRPHAEHLRVDAVGGGQHPLPIDQRAGAQPIVQHRDHGRVLPDRGGGAAENGCARGAHRRGRLLAGGGREHDQTHEVLAHARILASHPRGAG